jgi:mono/diheme cytochrome c family protein
MSRSFSMAALFVSLSLCVCLRGVTQAAPPVLDGKALFQEKCAMCHGQVGMGTGLLGRRIQPAELAARRDLNAMFVETAARIGIGNMPAIPRGEVSDAELKAIAQYLATPPEQRP